ncbi:unnamed protein product [Arabidopsis lyrata]|nr:unnamed protein product [Arabidopsis lyrata]
MLNPTKPKNNQNFKNTVRITGAQETDVNVSASHVKHPDVSSQSLKPPPDGNTPRVSTPNAGFHFKRRLRPRNAVLLFLLAASCFVSSFTDSVKAEDVTIYFDFVTFKGMWVVDYPDLSGLGLPDETVKISLLFMVFPARRHGIGYLVTGSVDRR